MPTQYPLVLENGALRQMTAGDSFPSGIFPASSQLVVPTGAVDGVNLSYTLPNSPVGDVVVYLNGVAVPETDYEVSGTTLTMTYAPQTGDVLTVLLNFVSGSGSSGPQYRTIGWVFDAGGGYLQPQTSAAVFFPYAGTITKMTLLADQTGSATVAIWKDTYANHPPTSADQVTSLSLSSEIKGQSGTLNIAVAAGDVFKADLSGVSTIAQITVVLEVTLT